MAGGSNCKMIQEGVPLPNFLVKHSSYIPFTRFGHVVAVEVHLPVVSESRFDMVMEQANRLSNIGLLNLPNGSSRSTYIVRKDFGFVPLNRESSGGFVRQGAPAYDILVSRVETVDELQDIADSNVCMTRMVRILGYFPRERVREKIRICRADVFN